jgi:PBP1b-binding outer membrane lipoprotein LpoB
MKKIILPLLLASVLLIGCVDKKKASEEVESSELVKEIENLESAVQEVQETQKEIIESAKKLDEALKGLE